MRALVVGGTEIIGRAVVDALRENHEMVTATRSGADFQVDITSRDSITDLYARVGKLDAVVSCAGGAPRGGGGPGVSGQCRIESAGQGARRARFHLLTVPLTTRFTP